MPQAGHVQIPTGSPSEKTTSLLFLQDMCTRVWDLRKPSESTVTLHGRLGAVRSLRYSPDGRLLAASEPADFVQLYDVTSGYTRYCLLFTPVSQCGVFTHSFVEHSWCCFAHTVDVVLLRVVLLYMSWLLDILTEVVGSKDNRKFVKTFLCV